MSDVSSTIIVGEWTLTTLGENVVVSHGFGAPVIIPGKQARDLAVALQVWLERNAHGAG